MSKTKIIISILVIIVVLIAIYALLSSPLPKGVDSILPSPTQETVEVNGETIPTPPALPN
ncbi:MAG: hypothetical protein LiPW41_692 [Parcubacteria group bacterium LiPW_41]|nr:MAG: hypothetical protein LiPW41_692 [Parcubacteria group bacterium LiPW_41]